MKLTTSTMALVLLAGLAAMAGPALAEDAPRPPVDRALATTRAPQFAAPLEAALTQKPDTLYQAALTGSATDKWAWGLALVAKRYDTDSVPPAQLKTFQGYSARVQQAKDKYSAHHKNDALPDKPMEDWVTPTADEAQAVQIVHTINTSDLWLNAARSGVDGAVVDQSVACLAAVWDQLSSENMMTQLMGGIVAVPDTKTDKPEKDGNSGAVDISKIMSELNNRDKSDEDLDNDALCGGAAAFVHVKDLARPVFTPEFTIQVTTDKK